MAPLVVQVVAVIPGGRTIRAVPPLGGWPEAAYDDQDDVNTLSLGGCRKSRAPSTSLACAGSGHGVAAAHHVNHPS
jgi:hypothetical protein